ncbi:MAG TPA: hypothetical protein VJ938_09400 [Acidimicrobiia bacterium]|jgi:hypothetical protein|nr:hypothetical protein [Acidimicrobiia bacterium]
MTHRDMHETDREVIVTNGGGSGSGMIIGIVLAILAVALVLWLLFGMDGDGESADVVPDDVNVTVDVEGGEGG